MVVFPQEAPGIGTYSHFVRSSPAWPRACPTCSSLMCGMLRQQAWQRGAATCHNKSQVSKIMDMAHKCGSMIMHSSVLWKHSEKNHIPWHSLSLWDSIFYHTGSRRTSASERILAELGRFQGPGLMGPFGLCGVPAIEARYKSLLSSLE